MKLPGRVAGMLAAALALAQPAQADTVQVAVAANFTGPMKQIAAAFQQATGHEAVLLFGATGKFAAQIANGAPFEVLLAADDETPRRLEQQGLAVPGSRSTYAVGRLVLYSAQPGKVDARGEVLRADRQARVAIANPRVAPYGEAALQTLQALGVRADVEPRLVTGESITQAFQYVASGNAELGFVALSQVAAPGQPAAGSWWVVPESLHAPIRQDAVLLLPGRDKPAARALLDYLKSEPARAVIRAWGYGLQ
ncbi:MAG: molybdate ABC transporter substrate-binding protein [Burkholderiales bacterium]|nr:molybdate ABC transporter substrate-binding protein [Burkholderiales bacterium]